MPSAPLLYRVVDVFTERPLEGNPLAVFLNGAEVPEALMQSIARELNLSETVFLLPPDRSGCAARLRIFTPARELPFAGHPTIGAAYVLLSEGLIAPAGSFSLEENVGPVAVRVEPGPRPLIWLRTPPVRFGRKYAPALCAAALGLAESDLLPAEPQEATAGNPTLFITVKDRKTVDRASLEMQGVRSLRAAHEEPVWIFVFARTPEGAYSRMFAPEYGIVEDPATGSSTGPLAAYMLRHGLTAGLPQRFVSEQGTKMGRRSILHLNLVADDTIEVGGHIAPLVRATMELDPQ